MLNQLKGGALISYISIFANNVIGLLYTPFLIRSLGQSEFGLYSLASSTVGYLLLMDMGFGNAIIRFTAKYRAGGDKASEARLHNMFITVYVVIGLIVAIAGFLLALNSKHVFSKTMTSEELEKVRILIILLTINISITLFFSTYRAIVVAYEKFIFIKVVDLVRIILNPILMIPFLVYGYKSIALVVVLTVLNSGVLISNYLYCRRKISVRPVFGSFNKSLFSEVIGYSSLVFVSSVVDQVYWNSNQFILGAVASTTAIAIYALAITIKNLYFSFSTAIISVFLPRVTTLIANNASNQEVSNLFIKIGRIQYFIISLVLSGFFLFGREFIHIWVGAKYDDSFIITLLIIIPVTIPLIQNMGLTILQAQNRLRFRSLTYLIIAIFSIIISIPMAKAYQGFGAALVTCVSISLGHGLIMNVYYQKKIQLDIRRFWFEIGKISIPILGAVLVFLLMKKFWFEQKNLFNFVGGILLYISIFIALVWKFAMNNYEKGLFKRAVLLLITVL